MTIVWHTSMTAHEYAAASDDLEVPRPDCPGCVEAMVFWGSYFRPVRIGQIELRLRVRRAICKSCRSSHALLPDLVAVGRLDAVEVIGKATEEMAEGTTAGEIARRTSLAYTTIRDWRRRFAARAKLLSAGLLAATVTLGDLVPRLPADTQARRDHDASDGPDSSRRVSLAKRAHLLASTIRLLSGS